MGAVAKLSYTDAPAVGPVSPVVGESELVSSDPLLIDVSRLIWRASTGRLPTGIDRACLAYVAHYRGRARAVVQYRGLRAILNREHSERLFSLLLSDEDKFMRRIKILALTSLFSWEKAKSGAGQFYFHVAHTGIEKGNFAAWVKRTGVRPVFFVHDLIPLTHAEYCREGEYVRHTGRISTMLHTGEGIICNSQATLDELKSYAARHNLPMPPACVAWLGASPLAVPADPVRMVPAPAPADKANGAEPPFFLFLGTIEARKNHLMILHIWDHLVRDLGDRAPRLKIVGQRGWECGQTIAMLDRCPGLGEHVEEISDCSDEMLGHLLKDCRALLFPSHVEGFGLPLAEALSSGAPVIASDLPVFRELAGDIPDYISPIDGASWYRLIADYARPDSVMRAAQIQRVAAYVSPTWADHFSLLDRWIPRLKKKNQ